MPTFINGIPLHALAVHAVVVLVPIAVLGGIVVSLWPAARRRYGWLLVAEAVLAAISIPIATSSGEGLEHSLPRSTLIQTHTHLGDELLIFVVPMVLLMAAFVLLHHRNETPARRDGSGTTTAPPQLTGSMRIVASSLAGLIIAFSVVSAVQVYRIGDTGARAAWSDKQYTSSSQDEAG